MWGSLKKSGTTDDVWLAGSFEIKVKKNGMTCMIPTSFGCGGKSTAIRRKRKWVSEDPF